MGHHSHRFHTGQILRSPEVMIEPAEQHLFHGESEKVIRLFAVLHEMNQVRTPLLFRLGG